MLTEKQVLFSVPVETRGTTWGVAESMEKLPRTAREYLACRRRMFQIKIEETAEISDHSLEEEQSLLNQDNCPWSVLDGSYRELFNATSLNNPYLCEKRAVENFSAIQKFFQKSDNPQKELEILEWEDLEGISLYELFSGMFQDPEEWRR